MVSHLDFWNRDHTRSAPSSLYSHCSGPITLVRWYEKGWHATLCKAYKTETWEEDAFLFVGRAGLWTWLFMLSKIIELGDTIFVVLRKQKLIFLHWYHHITVMTYAWYFYAHTHTIGGWYTWMNYFVHSFMYSYYTVCASGRWRPPKGVSILITLLQLLQMVSGLIANLYVVFNIYLTPGFYCDGVADASYSPSGWGAAMYCSYFVLFVHFFYTTYVKKVSSKLERDRSLDGKKTSLQSASNGAVHNSK